MVIEDENQIRRLLKITLSANGFKISEAVTGREGIIAVATHVPSLILLDLGLPDEDGQLVLQKLREWYKNPVIILSARSDEEDIVKALDNNANDLTKPFRNGELLARIQSSIQTENNTVLSFGNLSVDVILPIYIEN